MFSVITMESFVEAIETSELSQSDKELLQTVATDSLPDCSSLSQEGVELAFSCLANTPNAYLLDGIIMTNVYPNSPIEFIRKYKGLITEIFFPEDLIKAMNSFDDQRMDFFLELVTEDNMDLREFYIDMMSYYNDPVGLKNRIAQKLPHIGALIDEISRESEP